MVAVHWKTSWFGYSPHMVEITGCHVTLHFLPSFCSAASPATLVALVLVDWHPLLYRLPATLVAIV